MVEEKKLEEILKEVKNDFSFLKDKVLAVLIFGSIAKKEKIARDIDICVVAPGKDIKSIFREILRNVNVRKKKYDVYIFEELPLYMKIGVIENHIPVFGDLPALGEYFYFFRKLWNDQKHRQKLSKEDLEKILK